MKAKKTKRNRLETAEASKGLARLWMVSTARVIQPWEVEREQHGNTAVWPRIWIIICSWKQSEPRRPLCPLHKNWISEII